MDRRPSILSTKKLSEEHRRRFEDAGIEVQEKNFITISYTLASPITADNDSMVLFTSTNAVKSLIQNRQLHLLAGRTIFCVGESCVNLLHTKKIAVEKSFRNAHSLAEHIVTLKPKEVILFAGNRTRQELPDILAKNKITLHLNKVYYTRLTPHKIIREPNAILFYSPSGVRSYLKENTINEQRIICIGQTTYEEVKQHSKHVSIADKTQMESVIDKTIAIVSKA